MKNILVENLNIGTRSWDNGLIGKKYNENHVQEAIEAVNDGRMSLREVEQSFNVQKSTIRRKVKVD